MILVIAEQREGKLNRASWEAVAAAQQAGGPIKIAVPGSGVDALASELASAEAEEVLAVEAEALGDYTADGYVMALAALVEQEKPERVFFAAPDSAHASQATGLQWEGPLEKFTDSLDKVDREGRAR